MCFPLVWLRRWDEATSQYLWSRNFLGVPVRYTWGKVENCSSHIGRLLGNKFLFSRFINADDVDNCDTGHYRLLSCNDVELIWICF